MINYNQIFSYGAFLNTLKDIWQSFSQNNLALEKSACLKMHTSFKVDRSPHKSHHNLIIIITGTTESHWVSSPFRQVTLDFLLNMVVCMLHESPIIWAFGSAMQNVNIRLKRSMMTSYYTAIWPVIHFKPLYD